MTYRVNPASYDWNKRFAKWFWEMFGVYIDACLKHPCKQLIIIYDYLWFSCYDYLLLSMIIIYDYYLWSLWFIDDLYDSVACKDVLNKRQCKHQTFAKTIWQNVCSNNNLRKHGRNKSLLEMILKCEQGIT